MALRFHTVAQHMTFVDVLTNHVTSAFNLLPNRMYDGFFVLENPDDVMYANVQVKLVHSAFGIGLPGGTSNIIQPQPVTVPPALSSTEPGLATVEFQFFTPPGGHACLVATIQPNGPSLNQNLTVCGVPVGVSALSFLLYGEVDNELIELTLQERKTDGTPIPANSADSWHPSFIAPPGTLVGGANPPIALRIMAHVIYSVGLSVNPSTPNQTHIFHIEGWSPAANAPNRVYKGEVDIKVDSQPAAVPAPDPFIIGGYQSPDVILVDQQTGTEISLGGQPGGSWDTLLRPNTDYIFRARVHNGSPTPAVNTVVRFWEFPGGVGSAGQLVDVQTVTIGSSDVIVQSAHPFHSAAPDMHKCAVVSIYNAQVPGMVDATTAAQVPNPSANYLHSASAWRNTDSMHVYIGQKFKFHVALTRWPRIPGPPPVEVVAETMHVPGDWAMTPEVAKLIREAGLPAGYPPYMVEAVGQQFQRANLKLEIETALRTAKVEMLEEARLAAAAGHGVTETRHVRPAQAIKVKAEEPDVPLTITGEVPRDAREGDLFVVNLVAHYPAAEGSAERSVHFTKVLHVIKRQ